MSSFASDILEASHRYLLPYVFWNFSVTPKSNMARSKHGKEVSRKNLLDPADVQDREFWFSLDVNEFSGTEGECFAVCDGTTVAAVQTLSCSFFQFQWRD